MNSLFPTSHEIQRNDSLISNLHTHKPQLVLMQEWRKRIHVRIHFDFSVICHSCELQVCLISRHFDSLHIRFSTLTCVADSNLFQYQSLHSINNPLSDGVTTKKLKMSNWNLKRKANDNQSFFANATSTDWEKRFENFSIDELVNVAETHEYHIAQIAGKVFVEKYCKDVVRITNAAESNEFEPKSVKLLHHFGHLIKHLKVNYLEDYRPINIRIDAAILKYCRKTIESLELKSSDLFTLYENEEPFPNVKKVKMFKCKLFYQFANFNQYFPNAEILILEYCKLIQNEHGKWFGKCFPALKTFHIIWNGSDYSSIDINHSKLLIELNPQLENLKIVEFSEDGISNKEGDLIAFLCAKLPTLKTFELSSNAGQMIKSNKLLHFNKLEKLIINFIHLNAVSKISAENIREILIESRKCNEICLNLLQNNQNANIISLYGELNNMELFGKLVEILKQMPNLEELLIPHPSPIESAGIIGLLINCKKLKKLTIYLSDCPKKNSSRVISVFNEINGSAWPYWSCCIKLTPSKYDYLPCFQFIEINSVADRDNDSDSDSDSEDSD